MKSLKKTVLPTISLQSWAPDSDEIEELLSPPAPKMPPKLVAPAMPVMPRPVMPPSPFGGRP